MEVEVKMTGMKELYARLDELDALGRKKLIARIVRRVAKPTSVAAKANLLAYRKSGALASAVGVYARRPRGQEVVAVQVAARKKDRTALFVHNAFYGRRRKGIFYGHLLEFGHRIGTSVTGWLKKRSGGKVQQARGAGGASAGIVRGRHWLLPAINSTQSRMVSAFVEELKRGLDAIARRRGQATADTENLVPP